MPETSVGRRERKNAATRTAIIRATLELTIEQGFEATTIAQIAEHADVAVRTVHAWFRSKEDIALSGSAPHFERLRERMSVDDLGTVDRIEAWVLDEGRRLAGEDELGLLRLRAIMTDTRLLALERTRLHDAETEIAGAVRRELGLPDDHLGAQLFAAATVAMLFDLRRRFVEGGADFGTARDDTFAMLRGAFDALQRRA
jgi:AcrR family transcriptional regulator